MQYSVNTKHVHTAENENLSPHGTTAFTQLSTRYDPNNKAVWCWLRPQPRPCLSPAVLNELTLLQQHLTATYQNSNSDCLWPLRHVVLASGVPGIYNLGGDLELFKHLIEQRDKATLTRYAHRCVYLLHQNMNNLELPITTAALVQGTALGGGFETALSCDVIVAERGTQMGLPEILFNLFPGMGAYNLLSRRIGNSLAERMILSGKTYIAEELYEMGVIDVLAEKGAGVGTMYDYLAQRNRANKTFQSIKKIRQLVNPVSYDDLLNIVEIWVENAMELSRRDLNKMNKLSFAQKRFDSSTASGNETPRIKRQGDWRKISDAGFPLTTHLGETVHKDRRMHNRRLSH